MLVRPLETVEVTYYKTIYTFQPTTWYEVIEIEKGENPSEDRFHIGLPDKKWPNNEIIMYRTGFESIFITKEEDRDLKIGEVLNHRK